MKRLTIIWMLMVVFSSSTIARQGHEQKLNYWGDVVGYMETQSDYALKTAVEILRNSPPKLNKSATRRAALTLIDQVVHLPDAKNVPALRAFYHRSMEGLIMQLKKQSSVGNGAIVYKLYNHGYIVKTKNATYGFDIYRGPALGGFALPDTLMNKIVNACDVLFVSHWHPDHADGSVAKIFIDQGKPVIAPDSVFQAMDFYDQVLHPKNELYAISEIRLPDGRSVRFSVLPGHQWPNTPNNIYIVEEKDNICFAHTGDQEFEEDFKWIDKVRDKFRIDLLFPNCWATGLSRLIDAFDPLVVIPGHNNEINHSVDHREAHWQNDIRMKNHAGIMVDMTWGEVYHYRKKRR